MQTLGVRSPVSLQGTPLLFAAVLAGLAGCNAKPTAMLSEAGADGAVPSNTDGEVPRGSSDVDRENLLAPDAWQRARAADDPFAQHRPTVVVCDALSGWFPEADYLEVDTGRCNYLSVQQALNVPLAAGEALVLDVLHFDLTAPEPARAHLALQIGQEVWAHESEIPAPAGRIELDVTLRNGQPRGTLVTFHLRNHGQNNWRLLGLRRK